MPTSTKKAPSKPATASKPKGGRSVEAGIAKAAAFNEAAEEAVENGTATGTEPAPITWPTEYGNPDMAIPPATPVVIVDGVGVEVKPERAGAYVNPETGESGLPTPPVTTGDDE